MIFWTLLLSPVISLDIADVSTISTNGLGYIISGQAVYADTGFVYNKDSVRFIGDINKDGWGDYAISAFKEAGGDGAVYVLLGSETALSDFTVGDNMMATNNRGFKIKGPLGSGENFGFAIEGGFDWNNDTIDDFAITSYNYYDNGYVYIILGKETGWGDFYINTIVGTGAKKVNGEGTATSFGYGISFAGDMNKDDYDDIIVTANNDNSWGGSAFVLFGGTSIVGFTVDNTMGPTKGFKVNGLDASAQGHLGQTCGYAGDVNSDGYSDILVTAHNEDPSGNAYLFFGGPTLTLTTLNAQLGMPASRGIRITCPGTGYNCGYGVGSAGDINGDTIDDFIVGARSEGNVGAVYIIYGRPLGSPWTSFSVSSITGSTLGFRVGGYYTTGAFGMAVSPAIDLNKDGYNDVIVAAYNEAPGGAVYVIFGNSTTHLTDFDIGINIDTLRGYRIGHTYTSARFGYSLAYLGDINKDGYNDFAIGASDVDSLAGKLYIISKPMSCTPGQYDNWKSLSCSTCQDLCNTCDDGLTCSTCKHANYTLITATGTCVVDCPAHCSVCSDTYTCTKCSYDNYTLTSTAQCILNCPNHCSSCINNTYCLECENSKYNLTDGVCNLIPSPDDSLAQLKEVLIVEKIVATSFVNARVILISAGVAIINFNNLSKMLQYIRYLAIRYPSNLQYILDNLEPEKPGMFSSIQDEVSLSLQGHFPEESLPPTLTEADPFFIVNFWSNLLYLAVILTAIGLVSGLERLFRPKPTLNKLISKLVSSIRWVFLLVTVCDYFTDVSFFTTIQFRHLNFHSTADVLNFLALILSNIILLFALIIFFYITLDINSNRIFEKDLETEKLREGWEEKWKEIRLIYEEIKPDSMLQISCTILICIRTYLFGMIVGGFTESPVFQTALILFLNVLMIFYFLVYKPIEELINMVSCLIDELILLCVNICLVWLAILDASTDYGNNVRDRLGMTIIICNVIFLSKFILLSAIQGLEIAFKAFKIIKMKMSNKKKADPTHSNDNINEKSIVKQPERTTQAKIFVKAEESQEYIMLQSGTHSNIKSQYSPNMINMSSINSPTYPFEHTERINSTVEPTSTDFKTQYEQKKLLNTVVENMRDDLSNKEEIPSGVLIRNIPKNIDIVEENDNNDNNDNFDNDNNESNSIISQNDRLEGAAANPIHAQIKNQNFVPSEIFEEVNTDTHDLDLNRSESEKTGQSDPTKNSDSQNK